MVGTRTRGRRRTGTKALLFVALAAIATVVASGTAQAAPNAFVQRNLVSDLPGMAEVTDANLVNPWGLSSGPTTPMWVANNETSTSTLYNGAIGGGPVGIVPLVVPIDGGAPTGTVFNPTTDFPVTVGTSTVPGRFLFASLSGHITAWAPGSPTAQIAASADAVYTGLALSTIGSNSYLYASDFAGRKIDVWNGSFDPQWWPGAFTDPDLPSGFAPFNVQALGKRVYVAYAKVDKATGEEEAGNHLGYVDVYSRRGVLLDRLIQRGKLNAPWGLAIAPKGFGPFSRDLLVGNFGNGYINAYDKRTGEWQGTLMDTHGMPIENEGLWGIRFGNTAIGGAGTLMFAAGIDDEEHGLFGSIAPAP